MFPNLDDGIGRPFKGLTLPMTAQHNLSRRREVLSCLLSSCLYATAARFLREAIRQHAQSSANHVP